MAHLFFGNSYPFNMGHHDIKYTPKRDFHYHLGASILAAGVPSNKSFTNPNFVNNLNKYQTHSVRSQADTAKNYINSSLINSIKEHCPDIIEHPNFCKETGKDKEGNNMGVSRTQNIDIKEKKERSQKRKQPRKNSKQNQNRQMLKELVMDYENLEESPQSSFEGENFSSKPNKFDLNKVLIDKPLRKLISTIPIPLARNKDMVVTLISQSPPTRHPQTTKSCENLDSRMPKPQNGHQLYIFDKQGRLTNSFTDKNMSESQNNNKDDENNSDCCDRLKHPSICSSEDSFIIFDDDIYQNKNQDTCQNEKPVNKLISRHRIASVCESEDSFIVFDDGDGDDTEVTDSDCDLTDFEAGSEVDSEDEDHSEEDSSFDVVEPRKVHFALPNQLCTVHPMIKWSFAYQAARKGPWEEFARDRVRFKDRIKNTEEKIKSVLDKDLRNRIYKDRFENQLEQGNV